MTIGVLEMHSKLTGLQTLSMAPVANILPIKSMIAR